MSLLRLGTFAAHSGQSLTWKIECDALTDDDWTAIAALAIRMMGGYSAVEGVPRGGMKLAEAIRRISKPSPGCELLIVDDVMTTGGSMEAHRAGRPAKGFVVFQRGENVWWVDPLFRVDRGAWA